MTLVTENQLDNWVRANSQEAQGLIVELVWRLVAASSPHPLERRFPLGDSIGQHGPDGVLNVNLGYEPFVPEGHSHWEIGTGGDARAKATSDYKDLITSVPDSVRSNSTFVFVTPLSGRRAWSFTWKPESQTNWVKERRKTAKWKDVRIIDGTRLIDWVRQFHAVQTWLAGRIHDLSPQELDIPERRWEVVSSYGESQPLPPEVFLVGRGTGIDRLQKVVAGEERQLNLKTRYPNEAIDFVCAYLMSLDEEVRVDITGRTLVVSSFEAWNTLCGQPEKLILVADPALDLSGDKGSKVVQMAQQAGHSLITCDPASPPNPNDIQLPTPRRHELQEALRNAGYADQRAETLVRRSNGNLSSLLRLLQGGAIRPGWATGPNALDLAMMVLLGSWSDSSDADRVILSDLTGTDYSDWIARAQEIARTPEIPIVHHEGSWKFTLRYEGWLNLGDCLYDQHLERFLSTATSVLSERDPQFDLPPKERYMAQVHEKVLMHSHRLRKGISESLALIGTHPEALVSCTTGQAKIIASHAVRELLFDADWERWAGLGNLLSDLAEASPDEFLKAVESALLRPSSPFDELFSQEEPGLFGRNYLSGLLWALESLAWDKAYLVRVCTILGELANRDQGGNWGNRPSSSLTRILLPWLPRTTAPASTRRAAITSLQRENPQIAWTLLLSLMPNQTETSTPTNKPAWRDTVPEEWDDSVTMGEYWERVTDYSGMMVEMAEADLEKLGELIDLLDDFPTSAFDQTLAYLSSDAVVSLPEEQRIGLWTGLTAVVRRHRAFSDADWALKEEFVSRIEDVAAKLAPHKPHNVHKMLFDSYDLPLYENTIDWDRVEEERTKRRRKAIADIFECGGLDAVIRFAKQVEESDAVGFALADIGDQSIDESLLPAMLETDDDKLAQFLKSYVWRRRYAKGWEWVDGLAVSGWTTSQSGRFLGCLPFTVDAWKRVEAILGNAEGEYWSTTVANAYDPRCDIYFAVEKLLANGRPRAALMCLRKQVFENQPLNEEQAFKALLAWPSSDERPVRIEPYTVVKIIGALQEAPESNRDRLMEVEWLNLALFEDRRIGSPKTLESGIANNPELFCKIIDILYPIKTEELSSDEDRRELQARSRNAWKLLRNWKIPPGTQPDGTFRPGDFKTWLQRVNEDLDGSELQVLALQQLGEVLVHSPSDPSGVWIHHSIAEALNDKSACAMLEGYHLGVVNGRGTHFVDWTGTQKMALAEEFTQKAEDVEIEGYPRLAAELRRIAEDYSLEAEQVRARAKGMEDG